MDILMRHKGSGKVEKIMYKIILVSIVLFFVVSNEAGAMSKVDYKRVVEEKLKLVNTTDGVDEQEAIILAQSFILKEEVNTNNFNFMRPNVRDSDLVKGCWVVSFNGSFKSKLRGLQLLRVHLDKKTGEVKSSGWWPS